MLPLGPFDPLTISAGILTNLAYDILKHRLLSERALEDSLFGKILKRAGIREPNFEERLLDTLRKTLSRYFKEYPQYALSGIIDFFQDPVVARQIGDYILDRRPIDPFRPLFHRLCESICFCHPGRALYSRRQRDGRNRSCRALEEYAAPTTGPFCALDVVLFQVRDHAQILSPALPSSLSSRSAILLK